jgi:hypothetical protein
VAYNVLQLPVVGVWNTQLSITTNGFLKIPNFLLPRLRQLLVGAVIGRCFVSVLVITKRFFATVRCHESSIDFVIAL